jgi:Flp pilus assembly protein TadD
MPSPDSGVSLKALARAAELQVHGRLDDAERVYAKLLSDDDGDPTVLINAGMLALARDDLDAAIERLERACTIVPRNAVAHAQRGIALMRAGRADEAREAFQRSMAIAPSPEVAGRLRSLDAPAG